MVGFVVDAYAKVTVITIKEGVNNEMDAEAIKAVEKMPKWTPGMRDGDMVKVRFLLPVRFKLIE